MTKEKYEIIGNLEEARSLEAYTLHVFGDYLAGREGYKVHEGLDALHFYLCAKYRWLPSTVKSMSSEDLSFLLREEMDGWRLPTEAKEADILRNRKPRRRAGGMTA